jgi:uncharacterized OB-fold protein
MKCPTCGTENDAQNRFCDQCGSRLEESSASVAPVAAAPVASGDSAACPSCGASVIPGEAYCDECGAPLNSVAPVASAAPAAPAAEAPAAGGNFCPACGHQNIPGDRFCDNCGAELEDINNISPEPTPAEPEAPAIPVEEEPAAPAEPEEAPPAAPAEPVEAPPAAPAEPVEEPAQEPDAAAEPEAAAAPTADTSADHQRLQDEIARQQQIISQFEQMVATFGAATPAAVSQGLDEARAALAQAELELSELDAPAAAPAVDPAELQRVQDEIARQQQIISQFEQMIATFGAAAPAAVSQGLDEARTALAQAELELTALTGGSAAAAPAAPAAPAAEAPAAPAAEPEAPAAPAVVETPKPRLTFDNGQSIELPEGKSEYIIGREDPVSGIFPEVDLTNYGGETGGVSRQHARLNVDANGQWTLTDLNSTNYTRVNQVKADPNVAVPISDGAQVQFGRVLATFRTS